MLATGTCANSTDWGHSKAAVKVEVKVSRLSPLTSRISCGWLNWCPINISSSFAIKSIIFHNHNHNHSNNTTNNELFN